MDKIAHLNIFQMRDLVRQFENDLPKALSYYGSLFREGEIDKNDYKEITNTIMSGYLIDKTILINMEANIVRNFK